MTTKLDDKLAALATMSSAQLRREWRQLYRASPPEKVGRPLLALGIAHRVQEKQHGGLLPALRRELDRLEASRDDDSRIAIAPMADLKPGTRLVREWHGETHQVELVDGGYLYRGNLYASLSIIARTITGARWSGPRFFGLARKRGKRNG